MYPFDPSLGQGDRFESRLGHGGQRHRRSGQDHHAAKRCLGGSRKRDELGGGGVRQPEHLSLAPRQRRRRRAGFRGRQPVRLGADRRAGDGVHGGVLVSHGGSQRGFVLRGGCQSWWRRARPAHPSHRRQRPHPHLERPGRGGVRGIEPGRREVAPHRTCDQLRVRRAVRLHGWRTGDRRNQGHVRLRLAAAHQHRFLQRCRQPVSKRADR